MIVSEKKEPDLFARLEEKNLLRQYDLLTTYIEIGLQQGPLAFDKYMLWALNHVAVTGIWQFGGRFREEPIVVGTHVPPHFKTVPHLMDLFVSFIHENWDTLTSTELAAYSLWRLNWIHPFVEGNGRTARATSYYLLSVKEGRILPGKKTVPERIRENRDPYYAALAAADRAWEAGRYDWSAMEIYLADLLTEQYREASGSVT